MNCFKSCNTSTDGSPPTKRHVDIIFHLSTYSFQVIRGPDLLINTSYREIHQGAGMSHVRDLLRPHLADC